VTLISNPRFVYAVPAKFVLEVFGNLPIKEVSRGKIAESKKVLPNLPLVY